MRPFNRSSNKLHYRSIRGVGGELVMLVIRSSPYLGGVYVINMVNIYVSSGIIYCKSLIKKVNFHDISLSIRVNSRSFGSSW